MPILNANKQKQALPPSFERPLDPCNKSIRRCPVTREEASERILIMRLAAHGDILMATPVVQAIREAKPNAYITWIAERKEKQSIDAHPAVDELILWDSPYFKRFLRKVNWLGWLVEALKFRRLLRDRHFDAFISYQPEEWPLLMLGSGAQNTIGIFDTFRAFYRSKTTSQYRRLYKHAFAHEQLPPHRTDQYLMALPPLGIDPDVSKLMHMGFTSEDRVTARRFIAPHLAGHDAPYVVLAPMTTWTSRCWPAERFAELGDRLEHDGYRVVLISSSAEHEAAVVEKVSGLMTRKPVTAAGTLPFRAMAALLADAAALVSGDTGPMHVAAAVGAPFVALFGSTPVDNLAPLAGPGVVLSHSVPCGPCYQKHCLLADPDKNLCMRKITVDEAYAAFRSLVNAGSPPQPSPKGREQD